MSNSVHFQIQRGTVVSDCMQQTYDFISENLTYLHDALIPVRDAVLESSDFKFICFEQNWSFAVNIDRVELGQVSAGNGAIQEGNQCSYDELLESISS